MCVKLLTTVLSKVRYTVATLVPRVLCIGREEREPDTHSYSREVPTFSHTFSVFLEQQVEMSELTKHFSTKTVCLWSCGEIFLELIDTLREGRGREGGRGGRERRKEDEGTYQGIGCKNKN